MASETEGTGSGSVSYRIGAGVRGAIKDAGAGGSEEYNNAMQNATIADGAAGAIDIVSGKIGDRRKEKEEATEAWDAGFDAMGDKGSWASGELFDQFNDIETGYRDEYVEAVRKNDKKAQKRLLKDQASRSSGLQGWKKTMETAKQINDGVGWSNAMKGDTPEAKENQHIMLALSKLDGKTSKTRFTEDQGMVFDITMPMPPGGIRTITNREANDMITNGIKPVKLHLEYLNGLVGYEKKGAEGEPFNFDVRRGQNILNIQDDQISGLMTEDIGGGGSFSDHIKTHPQMIEAFKEFEYTTQVESIDGGGKVSVTDAKSPGGENIMPEEIKNFNDDDLSLIIEAMQKDTDVAKGYLADWKTTQEQTAHSRGARTVQSESNKRFWESLGKDAQEKYTNENSLEEILKLFGFNITL
tara:strand:+ start:2394 stop:3632 length:1239 start_codon:yes stop_codon:yes gene_type:complete